eukprot:SAG11_NODE_29727_length_307_cov_220.230769_2_plen_49_part_01
MVQTSSGSFKFRVFSEFFIDVTLTTVTRQIQFSADREGHGQLVSWSSLA